MTTPSNLTLGDRIRLAADGPDVPSSTRAVLDLLATDADTLTRVGERLVLTQPDPDGGVEMTDSEWAAFRGEVKASRLGDAIRAIIPTTYTDDGYFGVTALEMGEFADRADALERERDQWHESAKFAAERLDRVQYVAALDTTPLLTASQLRAALDGAL